MQHLYKKKLALNLICHPQAVPAFELTQEIFCSSSAREISKHKLKCFGQRQHLQYFERSCGHKVFYTGWVPLLLDPESLKKDYVLNGPSHIEFRAWSYVLDAILTLSKRSALLPNLALFFSYVPPKIKFRFFVNQVPRTLKAQLVEFTGESPNSIRYFLRNMEKK